MDRETFKDTLRQKYADDIREAYLECEHKNGSQVMVDQTELMKRVSKLLKCAKSDGFTQEEFAEIAESAQPGAFGNFDFMQFKKTA